MKGYTSRHHQLTEFATDGDANVGWALAGGQTGALSLSRGPRKPECVNSYSLTKPLLKQVHNVPQ